MDRLILASASPQRKTLLAGLGLTFDVIPSELHEPGHPELSPAKRAQELAQLKAQDVWSLNKGAWVIGSDTLVEAGNGLLLEKPESADDARKMLKIQSNSMSTVHSGLTVIDPNGKAFTGLSSSRVTFKKLSSEDIEWWIKTDQWKDRSGSFQIDGLGQLMIANLEGDWTSVVGLPVYLLAHLLRAADAPFLR